MKSYRVLLQFFLVMAWVSLSGCYYQRDIQNQTVGSGGVGLGIGTVVSEAGGSIVGVGATTIAGSMIGSTIGQHYDNQNAFMKQGVLDIPAPLFTYQVMRPDLTVDCFTPGRIYLTHNSILRSANHYSSIGNHHD